MERYTSNIEFYCRESRKDKQGYSPIEMSININGERVFLNLPRKEKPSVFGKRRKNSDLQGFLDIMRGRYNTILTEMYGRGEIPTARAVRDYFRNGGQYKAYTLDMLCKEFLEIKRGIFECGEISKAHYKKFEYCADTLREFFGADKDIKEITPGDMQRFYVLLKGKYNIKTSASYMTKAKAIMRYGMDNGKMSINVCQNIKINKGQGNLDTISMDELERIINKDFHCDRLNKVRDMFVFACGSGLAYCDCCQLKPEDFSIENGHMVILQKRQKTNVQFCSFLLPFACKIVEKYNGDFSNVLSSNQKTNAYLKEIGDLCGIKMNLHFHLARHFYITYLVNKGVRVETVAAAVGHSSTTTTLKYYAKVERDTIMREIGDIA